MALGLPKARRARSPVEARLALSQMKKPTEGKRKHPSFLVRETWVLAQRGTAGFCGSMRLLCRSPRPQGSAWLPPRRSAEQARSLLAEEKTCRKAEMKASNLKSSRQMRTPGGEKHETCYEVHPQHWCYCYPPAGTGAGALVSSEVKTTPKKNRSG